MSSFEDNTHVFIIRIWREPREIEGVSPAWRGVIEHAFTGERGYVDDLDEIRVFISAYLSDMGVEFGIRWRIKRWLRRLKLLTLMNHN